MNPDRETQRIIVNWLNRLLSLVRQDAEEPVTDEALRDYTQFLSQDLPSGAFTVDSLREIAGGMSWWPDYAALRRKLIEWWREHKPASAPLLGYEDTGTPLAFMDRIWLEYYDRRIGVITTDERRANLQSLIRQQSQEAWRRINDRFISGAQPANEDLISLRAALAEGRGPLESKIPAEPARASRVQSAELNPKQREEVRRAVEDVRSRLQRATTSDVSMQRNANITTAGLDVCASQSAVAPIAVTAW